MLSIEEFIKARRTLGEIADEHGGWVSDMCDRVNGDAWERWSTWHFSGPPTAVSLMATKVVWLALAIDGSFHTHMSGGLASLTVQICRPATPGETGEVMAKRAAAAGDAAGGAR